MADRGMRVTAAGGSSRAALCIGVSKYPSSPLQNSAHDAADVADALRSIGFEATLLLEPSLKQMVEGVETFVAALQPGGTAVFFFAGVTGCVTAVIYPF
jgi:uncharacterized caspase-like protein